MSDFIELARRYKLLTEDEQVSLGESKWFFDIYHDDSPGWDELLQHQRVVILAEAGSGKTEEMMRQRDRLREEGKKAFFVPLEALAQDSLEDCLSPEEEGSLDEWKTQNDTIAYFFLDSVDELKLTEGKLDRALLRLAKGVGPRLGRIHIILSSRPLDWNSVSDTKAVLARTPIEKVESQITIGDPEELFLATMSNGRQLEEHKHESTKCSEKLMTYVMLSLSSKQAEYFAEHSNVVDLKSFINEVDEQDAWEFARRPLDLIDLVGIWNTEKQLGTKKEQHRVNVENKLKEDPERPRQDVLSESEALDGAERLALALFLTKKQSIQTPGRIDGGTTQESALDPARILPEWTPEKRHSLLRRALFDPATYGRIRFHHRSVQEYLAARCLKRLRDRGMATKALFRLLFADSYEGIKVVLPSMQPVAAWLSLWDQDVCREVVHRQPELLMMYGDPGSLDIEFRKSLLKLFVEMYGEDDWRGFSFSIGEIRRLADKRLSATVQSLWGSCPANGEVRKLLLRIMWQGRMDDLVDIAHAVAFDSFLNDYDRIYAVKTLVECSQDVMVRGVIDSLLQNNAIWSREIIYRCVEDIFPDFISASECIRLIEMVEEPSGNVDGFEFVLGQIVDRIDPLSQEAVDLRDGLADLIWRYRDEDFNPYRMHSRYGHLVSCLAILCRKQIESSRNAFGDTFIYACVVANRFNGEKTRRPEEVRELNRVLSAQSQLREPVFWGELEFLDRVQPEEKNEKRLNHAEIRGILGKLDEPDRPWLEDVLKDDNDLNRREIALLVLLRLWRDRGRVEAELSNIRRLIDGEASLDRVMERWMTPPERDNELLEMERTLQKNDRKRKKQEADLLNKWKEWRHDLMQCPGKYFDKSEELSTLSNLYEFLYNVGRPNDSYNIWYVDIFVHVFGDEVVEKAKIVFQEYWRSNDIKIWSERPADEKGLCYDNWLYGLCGLYSESDNPDWAKSLTPEEARIATRYSTLELNGLATFIVDIASEFPEVAEDVLGSELEIQLTEYGECPKIPMLYDLSLSDVSIKSLLEARVLSVLDVIVKENLAVGNCWKMHLHYIFSICREVSNKESCETIATICSEQYANNPQGDVALTWLKGAFLFDPVGATYVFCEVLEEIDHSVVGSYAVYMFGGLFGDFFQDKEYFKMIDPAKRANCLCLLAQKVYAYVRREDDIHHQGTFSPGKRDDAQSARRYLFNALLETPGYEAAKCLLDLSDAPDFQHFPDRIRHLVREKVASECELQAYSPEGVISFFEKLELAPFDRDSLFTVMMDRLHDIQHDIRDHDFTDRRTLRRVEDEPEMQPIIAKRFEEKSKGAYTVIREDEVADKKKADFRLIAPCGTVKAAIELKISENNYSVNDFCKALHAQLVGQYLRHETCRAGCLLLTYSGNKKHWVHPETKARMTFDDVVVYLKQQATDLEIKRNHEIRLGVFGLDLTDPYLAPAH